jgi:radical SAM superfamily enzyme YgiQ (UPF0313 family)
MVSDELLRAMRSAGCIQVDFGIESASPRILRALKKGGTPEQAVRALELAKKNGIKSFASFMVGLPGETEEDLREDVRFLEKIKPDFTYFNLFTPFPGTEIAETAIKEGRLPADFFDRDYDMLLETAPLVNLSDMPTETVIRYHKKLRNMVLFKNYIGIINRNNIALLLEAAACFLMSPRALFRAAVELARTRNIEKFIFLVFSNFQKKKTEKALD